MREILELGAVEKAIERMDEGKLAALAEKEQIFSKAIADGMGRERFLLDQEFHVAIVELSGNLVMPDYYREIYQKIFLRHRISPIRGERTIHAPAEHHEIFEALRQRDLARAKEAVSAHIEAGREYIYSFMF